MFIWSDTYGFYWDITAFGYNSSLINGFEAAEKRRYNSWEMLQHSVQRVIVPNLVIVQLLSRIQLFVIPWTAAR